MSLTLKNIKNKFFIKGVFCTFTRVFNVIARIIETFWYFYIFFYFLNEKSYWLWNATRWPKSSFYHLPRYAIVSFSVWSGTWQLTVVELSLIVVWFFFYFFYLLTGNVHYYPFCFLPFNFSPHSLYFLFHSSSIYRNFLLFNLVLELIFLICFFF
jgi:hypothetical protein